MSDDEHASILTGPDDGAVALRLTANGRDVDLEVDPRLTLLDLVRDDLGLTGTHMGCQTGDCGACTVALDGRSVKSCLMLAGSADEAALTTIEGFAGDAGELDVVQQSFWDEYGFQCGYCLPGMLFVTRDLLATTPSPTDDEIRTALVGNLCRCTGYVNVVRAVRAAAERLAAG